MYRNHTQTHLLAVLMIAVVGWAATSQAATIININNFTPVGDSDTTTDINDYGYTANPSQGTLGTITRTVNVPVNSSSAVNSTVYSFTLTNLTIDSTPGFTLTWDITFTASDDDGLLINGGGNRTWIVDDSAIANGTKIGGVDEEARINPGESITLVAGNIAITGGAAKAAFVNFTDQSLSEGTGGVATVSPNTLTITHDGVGTGFRLDNIDFQFTATLVPTPAALPAGLAMLGTLVMRRRGAND